MMSTAAERQARQTLDQRRPTGGDCLALESRLRLADQRNQALVATSLQQFGLPCER